MLVDQVVVRERLVFGGWYLYYPYMIRNQLVFQIVIFIDLFTVMGCLLMKLLTTLSDIQPSDLIWNDIIFEVLNSMFLIWIIKH